MAYPCLAIELSAVAIARATTDIAGSANGFASMLTKKTFRPEEGNPGRDWGVWHYYGDFPLDASGVHYWWVRED